MYSQKLRGDRLRGEEEQKRLKNHLASAFGLPVCIATIFVATIRCPLLGSLLDERLQFLTQLFEEVLPRCISDCASFKWDEVGDKICGLCIIGHGQLMRCDLAMSMMHLESAIEKACYSYRRRKIF